MIYCSVHYSFLISFTELTVQTFIWWWTDWIPFCELSVQSTDSIQGIDGMGDQHLKLVTRYMWRSKEIKELRSTCSDILVDSSTVINSINGHNILIVILVVWKNTKLVWHGTWCEGKLVRSFQQWKISIRLSAPIWKVKQSNTLMLLLVYAIISICVKLYTSQSVFTICRHVVSFDEGQWVLTLHDY